MGRRRRWNNSVIRSHGKQKRSQVIRHSDDDCGGAAFSATTLELKTKGLLCKISTELSWGFIEMDFAA